MPIIKKGRLFLSLLLILPSTIFWISPSFAGTTYSFTNAGATGRTGPIQSQINSAYASTTLAGQVTINTVGIQEWTVPATGAYSITAVGARGGGSSNTGKGAKIYGEFNLTQGQVIKILVGQMGSGTYNGGGGGGSFAWLASSATEPLIAAGGGGGRGGGGRVGVDASVTTSGTAGTTGDTANYAGAGGTNGSAGETFDYNLNSWDAAAGAGWKGNSANATQYSGTYQNFAYSPANGGNGGLQFDVNGDNSGGFGGGGGGGGSGISTASVGAGGGGYSGGGNGSNDSSTNRGAGGGGGSYNAGTNQSSTAGFSTSHGYVTIVNLTIAAPVFNSFSFAGNATTVAYRSAINITANLDIASKVTFKANGVRIPNCISLRTTGASPNIVATCNWKPTGRGRVTITAFAVPTSGGVTSSPAAIQISVANRSGNR
jgi:hypothetical protein